MRNSRIAVSVLAFTVALLATACGSVAQPSNPAPPAASSSPAAQPPKPLQNATLRLDWVVSGYHAPFYLGLERGYYKDEGIDLSIGAGNGSGNVAQAIGNGSDTFGLVDGSVVMADVSKGLKIKAVMGILQTTPFAIMSTASANVHAPKDLAGKTMAVTPGQGTYIMLPAFLAANHLSAESLQLKLESVSGAARDQMLLSGHADSVAGWNFDDIPPMEAKGAKLTTLNYADYGISLPSLCIVVPGGQVTANADLIRRFVKATTRAFSEAQKDPAAAIDALVKLNPNVQVDKPVWQKVLELSFKLYSTPNTQGHPFGWMSLKDWSQGQDLEVKYQGIKPLANVQDYFTNEFIPES